MEFFRCDSPDCGYVTEDGGLEKCPQCGGTFFIPVEEDYVSGYGWMCLADQAEEKGENEKALGYIERAIEEEYPPALYRKGHAPPVKRQSRATSAHPFRKPPTQAA